MADSKKEVQRPREIFMQYEEAMVDFIEDVDGDSLPTAAIEAPTGAGKTRAMIYFIQTALAGGCYTLAVVCFPNLSIMQQFLSEPDILKLVKADRKGIIGTSSLVNKDDTEEDEDDFKAVKKLCGGGMFASDKSASFVKTVKSRNDRNLPTLIATTYASLRNFTAENLRPFAETTFATFDEAHHVAERGNVDAIFETPFYAKALFYSASFPLGVKNDVDFSGGDGDDAKYSIGEKIIKIGFAEARDAGILKNLQIVSRITTEPAAKDGDVDFLYQSIYNLAKVAKTKARTNIIAFSPPDRKDANSIFCMRAMEEMRDSVIMAALAAAGFDDDQKRTLFFLRTGEPPRETKRKLAEFNNACEANLKSGSGNERIIILFNCKKAGEGVDTKYANCVAFFDPKNSFIDIIQCIGRGTRATALDSGLNVVYLNSRMNRAEVDEMMAIEGGNNDKMMDLTIRKNLKDGTSTFGMIAAVVAALCTYDDGLRAQIIEENFRNKVALALGGGVHPSSIKLLPPVSSVPQPSSSSNNADEKGGDGEEGGRAVVVVIGEEESSGSGSIVHKGDTTPTKGTQFFLKVGEKEYREVEVVSPSSSSLTAKPPFIDVVQYPANRYSIEGIIAGGLACVIRSETAADEEASGFYSKLKEIEAFVSANEGRAPSKCSKPPAEKKLGKRISRLREDYKFEKNCMADPAKRAAYEALLEKHGCLRPPDHDGIFYANLKEIEAFAVKEGRAPSKYSKTPVEKKLGIRLYVFRVNYKAKKYCLAGSAKRAAYEALLEKHECLRPSDFYANLKEIEAFVSVNEGARPSKCSKPPAEKALGKRISRLRDDYKFEKNCMADPAKRAAYEALLEKHGCLRPPDFYANLKEIEAFAVKEGRAPSKYSKTPVEKKLGIRLYVFRRNYKIEKQCMADPAKRAAYEALLEKHECLKSSSSSSNVRNNKSPSSTLSSSPLSLSTTPSPPPKTSTSSPSPIPSTPAEIVEYVEMIGGVEALMRRFAPPPQYAASHTQPHKEWKLKMNNTFASLLLLSSAVVFYLDDPNAGKEATTSWILHKNHKIPAKNLHLANPDQGKLDEIVQTVSKGINVYPMYDTAAYEIMRDKGVKLDGAYLDFCTGDADTIIRSIVEVAKLANTTRKRFILGYTITKRDPKGEPISSRVDRIEGAIRQRIFVKAAKSIVSASHEEGETGNIFEHMMAVTRFYTITM